MGGRGSGPRLKPCGTLAAYKRHRRRGEQPCRACMDAHLAYNAQYAKPSPPFRVGSACEQCNGPLPRGYAKYCSAACKKSVPRGFSRVWIPNCLACKKAFVARHPNVITCSKPCSRKRGNRSDDYHRWKRSVRRSITRDSDITPKQEAEMRRRARKCRLCGVFMTGKPLKPNSKHLDHIIPICIGGTHTHGNVRIICMDCNLKRPKDGSDYYGPVTLWAMAPGIVITPKPQPKPKPAPKPRLVGQCGCGAEFIKHNPLHTRCNGCLREIGKHAAELRRAGLPWSQIASEVGYRNIGNLHTYAVRWGDLAASRR